MSYVLVPTIGVVMGGYKDRNIKGRATTMKAVKAMELRAAGSGWQEVAVEVGYSNGASAYNLVKRELERLPVEAAREMRVAQHARLLTLLGAVWEKATDPDHPQQLKAVDSVRAIVRDISDLFRLGDIPVEVEPTVVIPIGLTEDEYYDALRRVRDQRNAESYADLADEDRPPEYRARDAAIEVLGRRFQDAHAT